eukprot:6411316-Amphidinium_carterae.1
MQEKSRTSETVGGYGSVGVSCTSPGKTGHTVTQGSHHRFGLLGTQASNCSIHAPRRCKPAYTQRLTHAHKQSPQAEDLA